LHLLEQISYEPLPDQTIELPPLQESNGISDDIILKDRHFVPERF